MQNGWRQTKQKFHFCSPQEIESIASKQLKKQRLIDRYLMEP